MNRDGTFNVTRYGSSPWDFVHPYHWLLSISWPSFFGLIFAMYLLANVVFALAYLLCGPGALAGGEDPMAAGRFMKAFFFSVQTIATIGYGKMTPEGYIANFLVAVEALLGLMGFALATGLLFSRFSRPTAKIAFSGHAVVAPYREGAGLMFRIANARSNELSEVTASVTLTRFEQVNGRRVRRFHLLDLERSKVTFLATQWVIVHPVQRGSPLHGVAEEDFRRSEPEILILLAAMDETFSQVVNARSSYTASEIAWGARFRDIHEVASDGRLSINVQRLGEYDNVELPG